MNTYQSARGMKIIGLLFVVYAGLVATHEGEFWPFSIYPMFSNAGQPWTRALVLDVSETDADNMWSTRTLSTLYGDPVPIKNFGVDQIDFSNFISKTDYWTPRRIDALHTMFNKQTLNNRKLLALTANGYYSADDSITIQITPLFLITADSVFKNPNYDFRTQPNQPGQ